MPRSFKLLVVALVLSNIGVGSFAFYWLRALDRKYSALLERAVPTLNDLQTLTAVAVEAMHRTNPRVLAAASEGKEAIERARQAIENDRQLRAALLQRPSLSRPFEERGNFERAGADFTRAASEFVDAMAASAVNDSNRERDEIVRPAFERYLIATTSAADALEARSIETSNALSVETGSLARMMLAAGNWPLAILLLLLLASVAMLIFAIRSSLFVDEERWRT